MKKILLFTAIFSAHMSFGQDLKWSHTNGSVDFDFGKVVKINNQGDIVSCGVFTNTVDFDPTASTTNITATGNGSSFIQKMDEDGNLIWVKGILGNDYVGIEDMVLDVSGNIYVTGYFNDQTDFDPGTGTTNLTPSGSNDVFLAKYDTNGDLIWANKYGGTNSEIAGGLTLDAAGNIYMIGSFNDMFDADPTGPGGLIIANSAVGPAGYLIATDNNGDFLNAYSYRDAALFDIVIDNAGDMLISGYGYGNTDFDLTAGGNNTISPQGSFSFGFVTKNDISNSAVYQLDWVYVIDDAASTSNTISRIVVDNNDNVLMSGSFSGNVDFDPGAPVANVSPIGTFTVKLNNMGDLTWAQNSPVALNNHFIDNNNDLYSIGSAGFATVDFDPAGGGGGFYSGSGQYSFIQKLDGNGVFEWVRPIETVSNNISLSSFDSDGNGTYYTMGSGLGAVNSIQGGGGPVTDFIVSKFGPACGIDNGVTQSGTLFTSDQAGATYQWLNCDPANVGGPVVISGETNQSFAASSNGYYSVIIDDGNCIDTSACIQITNVGIEEYSSDFMVYPNPSNGILNIDIPNVSMTINVIDITGAIVAKFNSARIDITDLSEGVYTLQILTDDQLFTKTVIKK